MIDDDVDRIMRVMEAAFDPQWGEAWNRRQVSDSLAMPNTHCLLLDAAGNYAEPDTMIAGFLLSRQAPGEAELLLVAVMPTLRGRGLGSKLIETFKSDAKARGAERVFLEMRHNNPAQTLYRAHGFEPVGKRCDYYLRADGSRLDAITFRCEL